MRRLLLISILTICVSVSAVAGSGFNHGDEKASRFRIGMNLQFTSHSSWQIDFGCHYMLSPYVGLGGSVGGWRQFRSPISPEGPNWWVLRSDRHPSNVFLRPSVLLMTGELIRIGKAGFGLTACPGVQLNVPHQRVTIEIANNWDYTDNVKVSTTKGEWIAVDCRAGLYMHAGPVYLQAGYVASSLNIYGMYRNLEYNHVSFKEFYPHSSWLQGGYVTVSYNF
ncbi:MAG: hypothetical protein K2L91_04650 [Duncaniella sp.]|nr:hypothetical protein [Duncaniella sp.]MDE6466049.1 hypothetical protein [Duncaniella sp.]MDE6572099.1 hypothetical protein [Duncaniella sp.]